MAVRTFDLTFDLDLVRTLGALNVLPGASSLPTRSEAWRATNTPEGPVTLHLRAGEGRIEAEAWGPGEGWMLDRVPLLLGFDDDPHAFKPAAGMVRDLHRRARGFRIGRTERVFEVLVPAILGQKVTGKEAGRSYRQMVVAFGEDAPGPAHLRLPPPAERIASLQYEDLHPFGVERKRAGALIEAARRATRLEEAVTMGVQVMSQRLASIRGIGPWTSALVLGIALGDPDAVPLGDYHIPNTVAWALAGEDRADDRRMLELLEPFRGHRRRVVLLIKGAGITAPKYGPRTALRSFERM